MKRLQARALALSVLVLSLAAAAEGVRAQSPRDVPGALPEQAADSATQRHEVVLRSWQDRVKIDGHDQPRRFEIVYDYRLGEARRLVYDAQDQLILDEVIAEQPRVTDAELAKAFDTVRRDPELGRLIRDLNAKIDGGFLLHEAAGKPCGPRTRCVQVFVLTESRRELHRRPIVDVGEQARIAHRDYKPSAAD